MGGSTDGTGTELHAVIEHLAQSGLAVTGHGENLATGHAAADTQVESALAGWRGQSTAALVARTQEWQSTTNALLTRLGEHAEGFHVSAQTFTEMVARHVQAIESVYPQHCAPSPTDSVDARDM